MITEPTPITLLYTACIGGRLELLPRLMTRIHQERASTPRTTFLIDLGCACLPGSWICDVTDGRGMLVAMDAMGYDAYHIGAADPLYRQPAIVEGLKHTLQTPLAAGPWSGTVKRAGTTIRFAARVDVGLAAAEPPDLLVTLQLSQRARADVESDGILRILQFDPGWPGEELLLGRIDLALLPEPPYIRSVAQTELARSGDLAHLMPDPTIVSVVEFVESEARSAQKRRGSA